MTELEDHAGTILGSMHQRADWNRNLWAKNQTDWARRALLQTQTLHEEATRVGAPPDQVELAVRILAGMYGGSDVHGWPQIAQQAVDWAQYALTQAGQVLVETGGAG